METSLNNTYLFKAIDAYPYCLEETIEALNYALSYDKNNVEALCLLAKVYAEQLRDYEAAKSYFAEALAVKMENPMVYPDYIRALICNEDYEEAQKLVDFAFTVKGTDKAVLHLLQGQLLESQAKLKEARKSYKKALVLGLNNCFRSHVEAELERVKKKADPEKKKEKKKKKSDKKRKKR